MSSKSTNLSKSRLMAARQCLKRVWLEVHMPELQSFTAATCAAFASGHAVGEAARRIYDAPGAVLIPYEGGLDHAIRKTTRLLNEGARFPIFEATLAYGGVLVRIDVLLAGENGWRIIEVKSSTSLKDEHVFDAAVQCWVLRGLGHAVTETTIAHIDTDFVYQGDGDYRGLLREVDIGSDVERLAPEVAALVRKARDTVRTSEPDVAVGKHCNTPYECPFIGHCWPQGAFPVQTLPRATKAKLAEWIGLGVTDLREVATEQLSERQQWVQKVARSGAAEILPGARTFARSLAYPRYYLDFETIAMAVPVWTGTRPYEVLPFQWSCHYEAAAGDTRHAEFVDLSGRPPMRLVAESLIRVLGHSGPVLTYSAYERQVINGLARRYADLAPALVAIARRLVDLKPVVENNYYHPGMAGSWSLKSVIPTIDSRYSYEKSEGIQDGTEASEGYLEAIDPATTPARKAELREQLLQYCRQDTASLCRLLSFFADA